MLSVKMFREENKIFILYVLFVILKFQKPIPLTESTILKLFYSQRCETCCFYTPDMLKLN